eukprot:4710295-Ditylum_brightwellii.AAC.1
MAVSRKQTGQQSKISNAGALRGDKTFGQKTFGLLLLTLTSAGHGHEDLGSLCSQREQEAGG